MTPQEPDQPWFSQRHLLERLEEELARCQRHNLPLSVAIGEFAGDENEEVADGSLPPGTAELILKAKRRCDVVGQYGPRGFLILMVHTPKPGGVVCCRRLQESLTQTAQAFAGPHLNLRAHFGLACTTDDAQTPHGLLRLAEEHLENARQRGAAIMAGDLERCEMAEYV